MATLALLGEALADRPCVLVDVVTTVTRTPPITSPHETRRLEEETMPRLLGERLRLATVLGTRVVVLCRSPDTRSTATVTTTHAEARAGLLSGVRQVQ